MKWLLLLVLCLSVKAQERALYKFSYHVDDKRTGQDFGQEEERLGYNTGGEYQVQLPDGRRQIVTYSVADENSGYVADVSYSGEPTYQVDEKPGTTDIISQPLPPIRSKPNLPRADKSLAPTRPLSPSPEEVRFISRPTKIVPTIIKLVPDIKTSHLKSRPIKVSPKPSKPITKSKPSIHYRKLT